MRVAERGSARDRQGNLPAEETSFVGRRQEVAEVRRLLSQSRLVTLTGPGGVGKTRLALRVAEQVRRAFPDGVWLVALADLSDPGLLIETVADTLGVQDRSVPGLMSTLTRFLSPKHLLLVMDNCEHLVDATAAFLGEIMPMAPAVRILATSRQSLGIAGEQTWAVPSLSVPDPDEARMTYAWARSEAVSLFVERAQSVRPSFALTPHNARTVVRISQRLDGIPLALELAAVRLRVLSAEQILQRLDDRFRLLTVGKRASIPRHQTLRALIDWSYNLCTNAERTLWELASVFSGGFDLDAVEQVCTREGIIATDQVLDLVDALVDKSILSVSHDQGQVRYRMLESLRQYAFDKMADADLLTEQRCRHRDYYQELTEQVGREWFGPDQLAWSARLRREHANLQAAMEFCLTEPGQAQPALVMAASICAFFESGHLSEGRHWLSRALALAPEPTPARATALWAAASLANLHGDLPAARSLLQECRELAVRLGDRSRAAAADSVCGWVAMCEGDAATAVMLLERSLAVHTAMKDAERITNDQIILSVACYLAGDSGRAIALCEECLAVTQAHGDLWHRSWVLLYFSWVMWREGDHRRAGLMAAECLRINRALDDRVDTGHCLEILAWVAAADEPEHAARLLGAAHATMAAIGAPLYPFFQPDHDRCTAATREALGDRRFTTLFEAGAALTIEQAAAEAMHENPPSAPPAAGESVRSPLTPREAEVARLAAQGLTNKEIARRLVISQRTAETHIQHILTKLGFTSRNQIGGPPDKDD
ncbi:ATP-binding protein [Nonomuraea sediminis]|uniref:ATP-binding protein n=1 Tax=Nonomuraea sediminis TaxID=2835864 RepID=UPI001BDDAA3A|nr:LuxR C-terminal-related transcriptional regulator [Nonomuraea sediminis]